jgi:hypothetical protein
MELPVRILTFLFLICLSFAAPASAADSDLNGQFTAVYATLKKAMTDHDREAISAIMAPDFKSIQLDNSTKGRDELINAMMAAKPNPKKESHTDIVSVTEHDGIAEVKQRYQAKFDQAQAGGPPQLIEMVSVSTDSWSRQGAGWICHQPRTDEIQVSLNGQVKVHQSRPAQ